MLQDVASARSQHRAGETVQIVLCFECHAGLYVLHCHNLEHEDAGTMLKLEVV